MPRPRSLRRTLAHRSVPPNENVISVLVVDDDESVLIEVCKLLETFRMASATASSTADALRIAASMRIDVALIDWRLSAEDDGIVLGRSLWRNHSIPFVLFSGFLDTETTGTAYKRGAADVIDKPIRRGRLLAAVRLALGHRHRTPSKGSERHSSHTGSDSISRRWAKMVVRACHSDDDPKTEPDVAKAGNVSTSVYRRDCDECGIEPRDGRDFIRLLRANGLAQRKGSTLRSQLGTLDPRTVRRLFERAGLPIDSRFIPLRKFFVTQRLIPTTKECLRELAHMAANDPLFFVEPEDDLTGTEGT
jgi:two-component system, response regulator PdtaR